jgi:hypothetical protein
LCTTHTRELVVPASRQIDAIVREAAVMCRHPRIKMSPATIDPPSR